MGTGPDPAPRVVGNIIAKLLTWLGPKGLEFGRYSLDYHNIRNWIYVNRHMGPERAARHTPEYAKRAIAMYNQKGEIDALARFVKGAVECAIEGHPGMRAQDDGSSCWCRLKPGAPTEAAHASGAAKSSPGIVALAALGLVASSVGAFVLLHGWQGGL